MPELPSTFAGLEIVHREPFDRSIELTIDSAAQGIVHEKLFPAFVHNMDFAFEVLQIKAQYIGLTANEQILDPQPTVLGHLASVHFYDASKNRIVSDNLFMMFDKNNHAIWAPPRPMFALRGETYELKAKTIHFNVQNFRELQKLHIKVTFAGHQASLSRSQK
jgi:hypothetical protein